MPTKAVAYSLKGEINGRSSGFTITGARHKSGRVVYAVKFSADVIGKAN